MKKKLIVRGLLLFLILLGLLEGVARFGLGLGTPPLSIPDSDVEYMFRPNQDVMRFGNRQLYNAYGMRSEDFQKEKPEGEIRIVCFGDSVLNGGNLTDHERLATTLLQRMLKDETASFVRVSNISAGSWGTPNMLAYAEKFGLFGADVVVVQLSSHDIEDVPRFYALDPTTHPTKRPCCALWEGFSRYAPRYIPTLNGVLKSSNKSIPVTPGETARSKMELGDHEAALLALDEMKHLVQQNGARLVLVLHAEKVEVLSGEFMEGRELFLSWAEQHSIAVVDLSSAEKEALEVGTDPYRQRDTIHLSDAGQRILAEQLYEFFKKDPLFTEALR